MLDAFGLNALFGDNQLAQLQPTNQYATSLDPGGAQSSNVRRIRVKASYLFQHLSKISLCLYKGPGFYRGLVDEAITSSIVPYDVA
jgi:hypothetical protein